MDKMVSISSIGQYPHSPYDRDIDDFGRHLCNNCGEYLAQYDENGD